jgi:putative membrane protein
MGAADIVPGVSGGTIALIFGIYERLVASVRAGSSALGHLLKADLDGFKRWMAEVDWLFIVPLGTGILLAVAALASILEHLLAEQPVIMAALFMGLVAASVVVAWMMIKAHEARHIWIAAAVGALAICAMILPGISGSFILVLLGMYSPLLSAVTSRDILSLVVFMIGAVVGLALFSQVLHRALTLYHDMVIAALVGLMAGSLRVLWPWPSGIDSTALGMPDSQVLAASAVAVAAFVIVMFVARFAQKLEASDHSASTAV